MYTKLTDTYFFTSTINSWKHLLATDAHKAIILSAFRYCCEQKRILLHAFVIMPNHTHLLLTLQNEETTITFQRDFLKFTAQQIIKNLIQLKQEDELNKYRSTQKDRIYHIWERRPKWITIQNLDIFNQKLKYLHNNPLQEHWCLAMDGVEYKWSSAAFYENNDQSYSFLTPVRGSVVGGGTPTTGGRFVCYIVN
ncbi:MAG TPA: transposase [Edaphocola sp.]|nr:transposase [Edaphocola sp.]